MGILLIFLGIILVILGSSKLSEAKNMKNEVNEISQDLTSREAFISEKEKNLSDLDKKLLILKNKIDVLNAEKQRLDDEINQKYDLSLTTVYESVILPNIEESSSSEIKNKLSLFKRKEKEFIADGAVITPSNLNNREANNLTKKILVPIESEVTGLLNKLTISNVDSTREKIIRTFDKINKLFKNDGAQLKKSY